MSFEIRYNRWSVLIEEQLREQGLLRPIKSDILKKYYLDGHSIETAVAQYITDHVKLSLPVQKGSNNVKKPSPGAKGYKQ
jgi:hypothetical protein